MNPDKITHGDVLEITEALREQGKRLKRLAARRCYIGPANAVYRQGLRKRARRSLELADIVMRNRPDILNLELISAELEPLGTIRACPRCDQVLEMRHAILWCRRCGRPVLRDELERAAKVNRVIQGYQDAIDRAVTDGILPG